MERLEKAKIINLDTKETFVCQFNPEEYSISKQVSWNKTPKKGENLPEPEFRGGQPATMKLKLLFDTTATGLDVRLQYVMLIQMTRATSVIPFTDTHRKEPAKCRFIWGKTPSFVAVITNISQQFTMFLGDGTPVRAKVDISLEEVKDDLAACRKSHFGRASNRSSSKHATIDEQKS